MKEDAHTRIRKLLSNKYVGYVLITCKHAERSGSMEVEMTYEGDVALASYLVEGARGQLDDTECEVGMELLS